MKLLSDLTIMNNLSGAQFTFFILYSMGFVLCWYFGFETGKCEILKYQTKMTSGYLTDKSIKVPIKSFLKSLNLLDIITCLVFPTYIIGLSYAYYSHRWQKR